MCHGCDITLPKEWRRDNAALELKEDSSVSSWQLNR